VPLRAADIDEAAQRIAGVVARSPLQFSERLSEATGATVYLKREDLQAVRSYKLRGAHNLLMQLSDDEIAAGVVCSSAGNHAQGFAMACRSMGIHGRVYVPAKTPKQKRDRIRYHGRDFIELIAVGKTYDEAAAAALDDVARTGATLVPPYDDQRTMAGQGTIAAEILDQLDSEPDLVIVPVGGGGCIAGMTTYLADRTTNTSVLGVEPAGAAAMIAALAAGEPVTLDHVDQFVDGAAVNRAGALTYAALAAAGCGDSPPGRTFFQRNIEPILLQKCAGNTSGCHSTNADDPYQFAAGNFDVTTFENVQKRLKESIPQKLKFGMTVMPFVTRSMKFCSPTKFGAGASKRRLRRP